MKAGTRALGVAESYRGDESTLAGCVVRADRVVDGFGFDTCSVGGTDATETIRRLFERLSRPDIRYILVAGIAPAWFNVVDLRRLRKVTDRPALAVSFEPSTGLGDAIREAFSGDARKRRLGAYRAQPPRRRIDIGGETLFVRAAGVDDERAARAADSLRRRSEGGDRS